MTYMSFVYNCKLLLENRHLPILFAHHLLVNCFYISTCSLSLLFNTKNEIFKFSNFLLISWSYPFKFYAALKLIVLQKKKPPKKTNKKKPKNQNKLFKEYCYFISYMPISSSPTCSNCRDLFLWNVGYACPLVKREYYNSLLKNL